MLSPAFPFGGMEHPGVTMFNEESFIYREPPTLSQRLGRRATIYHEVAHQWFGDDVTMQWFDDLWLKEGFATYMAAKMQDIERTARIPGCPSICATSRAAYDVDQTSGTTPVWQQLANLDQAKSNYGAIVYNKAPGILKQLNYLVGDSAFQTGVHNFLIAHAYGNATWQDLLGAIGDAAPPLARRVGSSVHPSPGHAGDRAAARHRRREDQTAHARSTSGAGSVGPRRWPMRTDVALWSPARTRRFPVEIRAETTVVSGGAGRPAPDFVFANATTTRTGWSCSIREAPRGSLATLPRSRDPFLRAMLWGALWDLVRDARLAPATFIATARAALPAEHDEQIASGIVSRLRPRHPATYRRNSRRDVRRASKGLCSRRLGAARELRAAQESTRRLHRHRTIARRIDRLVGWLDSTSAAGLPLRQPTRWSIVTHLIERRAPGAETLLAAEARRDTTTGGKRSAFIAAPPVRILRQNANILFDTSATRH